MTSLDCSQPSRIIETQRVESSPVESSRVESKNTRTSPPHPTHARARTHRTGFESLHTNSQTPDANERTNERTQASFSAWPSSPDIISGQSVNHQPKVRQSGTHFPFVLFCITLRAYHLHLTSTTTVALHCTALHLCTEDRDMRSMDQALRTNKP